MYVYIYNVFTCMYYVSSAVVHEKLFTPLFSPLLKVH